MTGSDRIIDHTTFVELQWRRDPFTPSFFALAPGFESKAHLFTEDYIEVLKDIHALQRVQDLPGYSCQNPVEMLRVDNQQSVNRLQACGSTKAFCIHGGLLSGGVSQRVHALLQSLAPLYNASTYLHPTAGGTRRTDFLKCVRKLSLRQGPTLME